MFNIKKVKPLIIDIVTVITISLCVIFSMLSIFIPFVFISLIRYVHYSQMILFDSTFIFQLLKVPLTMNDPLLKSFTIASPGFTES